MLVTKATTSRTLHTLQPNSSDVSTTIIPHIIDEKMKNQKSQELGNDTAGILKLTVHLIPYCLDIYKVIKQL